MHGAADVFDDARSKQLPSLHKGSVILVLEVNRYSAQGILVAVADIVQPLVKVQRPDDAPIHGDVGRLVQAGDLPDAVFSFITIAVFGHGHFHADIAALLKAGLGSFRIAGANVD